MDICEESKGLFILRSCGAPKVNTCRGCSKHVCLEHSFKSKEGGRGFLCLSCYSEQDTRLTKDVGKKNRDRGIWRSKMKSRFHDDYDDVFFMAQDYGDLFLYSHDEYYMSDNSSTYFDS